MLAGLVGPREAGSGRVGPVSGVGEGLGMHWETTRRLGAEWDRVGPSRAGACIGIQ